MLSLEALPLSSFQTSWKTVKVLPVPVAISSSTRFSPWANCHSVLKIAISW